MTRRAALLLRLALPLLIVCAFGTLPPAASAETIRLASLEWPPYIGPELAEQGYAAAVVREAFRREGFDISIEFLPWQRVLAAVASGEVHGYFPEYDSPRLQSSYLVSSPFPGGRLGFFSLFGRKIAWKTLRDLAPYRIAVVRGYINTEEFDAARYLKKEFTSCDLSSMRMLAAGRVDLAVMDENVGRYLMASLRPSEQKGLDFLKKTLGEKTLHVCFARGRSDSERLREAFDRGLAAMIDDGTLNALRNRLLTVR